MITVKELIEQLSKLDEDRIVILSKDSEGNLYSPLIDIDGENCCYHAETTWYGDIALERLTPELEAKGYTEEDLGTYVDDPEMEESRKFISAVILWPTN